MFEGRPQRYGTQLETDDEGWLRPYAIEDRDGVDERRKQVGLGPLATRLGPAEHVMSPAERAEYEREYQAWLRRVGWRSP